MNRNVPQKKYEIVIENLEPSIEHGRFNVKTYVDDSTTLSCRAFVETTEVIRIAVCLSQIKSKKAQLQPMQVLPNDRWAYDWQAGKEIGFYEFSFWAGLDRLGSWKKDFLRRDLKQHWKIELQILQEILHVENPSFFKQASKNELGGLLKKSACTPEELKSWVENNFQEERLSQHFFKNIKSAPRLTKTEKRKIFVAPAYSRFSAWYEFFPRSNFKGTDEPQTLKQAADHLQYVQRLGFDIVYLPPIHPIGQQFRKGKNNSLTASRDDVGSPWAIGSQQGGHKAVAPELGGMPAFKAFMKAAEDLQIKVALDIAFQCSPDHPYVTEHPEWFKKRPDGTIQYAENPPKKYQDIYPFDFSCENWQDLWIELYSVVEFWIHQGIQVFRVDNPHTKDFAFWEWLLNEVHEKYPGVIFLAEAFTRPGPMDYLAKIGYNQSYTYFTWRESKWELEEYFKDLFMSEKKNYFIPSFWPNTPDILPKHLMTNQESIFKIRHLLAATSSTSYGIYGPVFELLIADRNPDKIEEYIDSEKYQIQQWSLKAPPLFSWIKKINSIRHRQPALQHQEDFRILTIPNDQLIAYSRSYRNEHIVVVVTLDTQNTQSGWLELPLKSWDISEHKPFIVEDLISGESYQWQGWHNYIELNPNKIGHILKIKSVVTPKELAHDHIPVE